MGVLLERRGVLLERRRVLLGIWEILLDDMDNPKNSQEHHGCVRM